MAATMGQGEKGPALLERLRKSGKKRDCERVNSSQQYLLAR